MKQKAVDVEIKQTITPFQIWALFALAALNMQDGFDILAISYAATAISDEWGISRSGLGIVFSAGLLGMMLGALFLSRLADKIGRKPVAIMGLAFSGVGMLLAMVTPSVEVLVFARILTGFGVGGILVSLNTLVAEYAGEKYRGPAIAIFQLGFPMGAFLSGFIAAWLLDIATWRYIFGFGAITSFVFIPIVLTLPESTEFLIKSKKPNALSRLNAAREKFGRAALSELPVINEGEPATVKVTTLLSKTYWQRTVLICLSFFMLLTLLYFMLTWTPKILVDMGYSEADGNRGGRLINLVGMLGIVFMGLFSLRFLPSMLVGIYLSTLALVLFSFGAISPLIGGVFITIGLMGLLLHGSMIGLYSTVPTLYPVTLRATGTGWAIGLSRFGAVLGPAFAGFLLDNGWSITSLFKAYAILAVIAAVMAFLLWRSCRKDLGKDAEL